MGAMAAGAFPSIVDWGFGLFLDDFEAVATFVAVFAKFL